MKGFLVVSCLLLVVSLAGCGSHTDTAYYYNPSWTRDGGLVLIKSLQSTSKDILGSQTGSTITQSLITIEAKSGATENAWFDVTSELPFAMSCSPVAPDYVAYLDGLNGGLFSKIVVRNISAGTHTTLDLTELPFSPGIKSFDWSNDAKKFVYCTTQEVRTRNLDGSGDALVVAEAKISFVSWKYGTKIAFVHTTGSNVILSLINADGTGRVDESASASVDLPQISSANTNLIYGLAGGSFCKVDISAGTPATTEVLANFKGSLPRISPLADRMTYSKNASEQSGVYILDIAAALAGAATAETKIK